MTATRVTPPLGSRDVTPTSGSRPVSSMSFVPGVGETYCVSLLGPTSFSTKSERKYAMPVMPPGAPLIDCGRGAQARLDESKVASRVGA